MASPVGDDAEGAPRASRRVRTGGRALLALYGLLLLVPSASGHVFDGLPASKLPEFLGLALLVPFVVSRGLRRLYRRLAGAVRPAVRRGLLAVGVVALLGKLALAISATPPGFLACYRSPLAGPSAGPCEQSYENPFRRFGVTRVDRTLDFAPDTWRLTFLNSHRFAFYETVSGNVRRDRLPIRVTWTGTVERPRAWTAEIGYVGAVAFQVDETAPVRLGARYDARTVAHVAIPPGRHRLTVVYEFDDGSRVGDGRTHGPYATFRLGRLREGPTGSSLVRVARPSGAWRVTGALVDGVMVLLAGTLAAACAVALNRDAWVPAVVTVAAASLYRWAALWPSVPDGAWLFLVLVLLIGHLAMDARPRRLLSAYAGILAAALFLVWRRFGRLDVVGLRKAGDDWLTYESFARSILETWSLRAGEDVFYVQPLFRYVRFAERLVLGDGDPLVSAWAIVALMWSLVWLWAMTLGRRQSPARALLPGLPGLLLLLLATSPTILVFLFAGLSEYWTWIVLPLLLPMLFVSSSTRAWLLGATLLGLSFLTRTNQLPGALTILGLFLWRGWPIRPRAALGAALVFGALALLPTLHNAYYGRRFVPLTASATVPEALLFPPARLRALAHDAEARVEFGAQVRRMLYVGRDPVLRVAVHGLLLTWVVATVVWVVSRRGGLSAALLVCVPLSYLLPQLLFTSRHAYPRHFVVGYIVTGAAVLLAGARWRRLASEGRPARTMSDAEPAASR